MWGILFIYLHLLRYLMKFYFWSLGRFVWLFAPYCQTNNDIGNDEKDNIKKWQRCQIEYGHIHGHSNGNINDQGHGYDHGHVIIFMVMSITQYLEII